MMSTKDWFQKGKFFNYRGHKIFWVEGGDADAPPLLLIHGYPTACWDWESLWPELTKRYRCITLDMIGFGFSDKPINYEYHILDQADIYDQFLKDRGVSEFHLLSHNYGDSVAQELVARSLDEVLVPRPKLLSWCHLNGGLFPETHRRTLYQKLLLSPIGALVGRLTTRDMIANSFRDLLSQNHPPTPAFLDAIWELIDYNHGTYVFNKLIRYIPQREANRERWVGALQNCTVPRRLIDGILDPVSGGHMAAHYKMLVPNPDVVLLSDCGHYPHCESPAQVLRHFLEFQERVNNQSSEPVAA